MRYTEARLAKLAGELLDELGQTHRRACGPNYDGTRFEPIVLPARFPNLLVNGCAGHRGRHGDLASRRTTSGEVDRRLRRADRRPARLPDRALLKHIKGPDFPDRRPAARRASASCATVYETGQGSLKLRGEWKLEEPEKKGNPSIIVTSIPYAVERTRHRREDRRGDHRQEAAGAARRARRAHRRSCASCCEMKKGTDPQLVMAYLYKHTPLADQRAGQPDLPRARPTSPRCGRAASASTCASILKHFLDFRMRGRDEAARVRPRASCATRIHILEGFENDLRRARRDDRASSARARARRTRAQKLMKRFALDEEQVDAILELKLYRLAKLEILIIQKELGEKRAEAKQLEKLLKSARQALDADPRRAARAHERSTATSAARTQRARQRRRARVPGRGLHRRRGRQRRSSRAQGWVKRAARGEGPGHHAPARGRQRARRGGRLDQARRSRSSPTSAPATCAASTTCRRRPATAIPCRSCSSWPTARRWSRMLVLRPARCSRCPTPSESAEPEPPFALAVTRAGPRPALLAARRTASPPRAPAASYARLNEGDEVVCVGVLGERATTSLLRRERRPRARRARPTRSRCCPAPARA